MGDQAGVGSRLRSKTYGISMGPRTFSSLARLRDWPIKPQTDKVYKKKERYKAHEAISRLECEGEGVR